jgi:hypothetical protein
MDKLDDMIAALAAGERTFVGRESGGDVDQILIALRKAIEEIKHLRSLAGAVSQGPSFAEAIKGVSRRSVEPEDPR